LIPFRFWFPCLAIIALGCGTATEPPPKRSVIGVVKNCVSGLETNAIDVLAAGGRMVQARTQIGCGVFATGGTWRFSLSEGGWAEDFQLVTEVHE
jgi:hypothetical protein